MSANWILAAVIAGTVIYTKFFDDQPIRGFFGGQPAQTVAAAATPEPTPADGWMFDPKRQGNLDKKAYPSGGKGNPGGRAVNPAGRAMTSKLELSRLGRNVVVE